MPYVIPPEDLDLLPDLVSDPETVEDILDNDFTVTSVTQFNKRVACIRCTHEVVAFNRNPQRIFKYADRSLVNHRFSCDKVRFS